MLRRAVTAALAALMLLGAAACGSTGIGGPRGGGLPTTSTGAGGMAFETAGVGIGTDGRVYRPDESAPTQKITLGGPLVPLAPRPLTVTRISDEGLQTLYRKADELGLLDEAVTTDGLQPAMDEPGYTVRIGVDGRVIEHHGLQSAADTDRDQARLLELHRMLRDLDATVGADLQGPTRPYRPHGWVVTTFGSMTITDEPRRWPFPTVPEDDSCVVLQSSASADTATGIYRTDRGDVFAEAAYPWVSCEGAPTQSPEPTCAGSGGCGPYTPGTPARS